MGSRHLINYRPFFARPPTPWYDGIGIEEEPRGLAIVFPRTSGYRCVSKSAKVILCCHWMDDAIDIRIGICGAMAGYHCYYKNESYK